MQGSSEEGASVWEIFLIPISSWQALLMYQMHLTTSGRHHLTLRPACCKSLQLPWAVWNEGKRWVIKGIWWQLRDTEWKSKEMVLVGRGKAGKSKHKGMANDTRDKILATQGFSTAEDRYNLPRHMEICQCTTSEPAALPVARPCPRGLTGFLWTLDIKTRCLSVTPIKS